METRKNDQVILYVNKATQLVQFVIGFFVGKDWALFSVRKTPIIMECPETYYERLKY